MKKVNFKNVLMALSLVLAFLFIGTENASAQTIQHAGATAAPAGTFVGSTQAKILLKAEIEGLKTSTTTLTGAQLNAAKNKLSYFGSILEHIEAGNTVKLSIGLGYEGVKTSTTLTRPAFSNLKQEAINLLSA